jgi:hypothetical protein
MEFSLNLPPYRKNRMPNECWNKVRLSSNPALIQKLLESEFSFASIRPIPESVEQKNWTEWCTENWGTKWDRYDYKLEEAGKEAILIYFHTAWSPPTILFKFLLQEHPEMWLRCDWEEEGGEAGVFVGFTNQRGDLKIQSMTWDDWCIEEYAHKFRKAESTNTHIHSEASE